MLSNASQLLNLFSEAIISKHQASIKRVTYIHDNFAGQLLGKELVVPNAKYSA
jgi:hypothetical protein